MPYRPRQAGAGEPARRRRRRPRRRGAGGAPGPRRLAGQRIGHAAALLRRDLLHPGPPLRHLRGRQSELARAAAAGRRPRGSADARARAARAARADAPAAAAARTSRARRARSAWEWRCAPAPRASPGRRRRESWPARASAPAASTSMMPAIGPYSSSANRNVGVTGLSAMHARVGVLQPCSSSFSTRLPGWLAEVGIHRRQQRRQQAAAAQHLEAARAVPGEEQLQRLVEQPRRRHAGQQIAQRARSARRWPGRSRSRASPRSAPRAACAPDLRGSGSPDRRSGAACARRCPRRRRRSPRARSRRCCSRASWR